MVVSECICGDCVFDPRSGFFLYLIAVVIGKNVVLSSASVLFYAAFPFILSKAGSTNIQIQFNTNMGCFFHLIMQ